MTNGRRETSSLYWVLSIFLSARSSHSVSRRLDPLSFFQLFVQHFVGCVPLEVMMLLVVLQPPSTRPHPWKGSRVHKWNINHTGDAAPPSMSVGRWLGTPRFCDAPTSDDSGGLSAFLSEDQSFASFLLLQCSIKGVRGALLHWLFIELFVSSLLSLYLLDAAGRRGTLAQVEARRSVEGMKAAVEKQKTKWGRGCNRKRRHRERCRCRSGHHKSRVSSFVLVVGDWHGKTHTIRVVVRLPSSVGTTH